MPGMDELRKPIGVIGIINVGLSFLMPFVGLQMAAGAAILAYYWISAMRGAIATDGAAHNGIETLSIALPFIFLVSTLIGVVNSIGYYRKRYGFGKR